MRIPVIVAFAFASVAISAGTASAEERTRPMGSFVTIGPDMIDHTAAATNTIFLDRCPGGCTLNRGQENAPANQSSIINGTVNISEYRHGDAS